MKHLLRQAFRSGKFLIGFVIFTFIMLTVLIYPLFVKNSPLETVSQGAVEGSSFLPPGIYVNIYDSMKFSTRYKLIQREAENKRRIASKLDDKARQRMKDWLVAYKEIPENEINVQDTAKLLDLWANNFEYKRFKGMTNADLVYFKNLTESLDGILSTKGVIVAATNPDTGALEEKDVIQQNYYANIGEVPNVRVLPLGTDNFGRDVMTELVRATGVSLTIGVVAGTIATLIGLSLGLLSGYMGGFVDDLIVFFNNLFTVIPTFMLAILISFSVGQDRRGAFAVALIIGVTAWPWTSRAVRAQVISLRNRDHVNLSKLSGHSVAHILLNDILPYIASYVVMALILQISSGILIEAQLSILGLGPRTTDVPTLGLMMNWALFYQAPVFGYWWAYIPVIFVIAMISFSMNLMNTGLDQVFNPALRE